MERFMLKTVNVTVYQGSFRNRTLLENVIHRVNTILEHGADVLVLVVQEFDFALLVV